MCTRCGHTNNWNNVTNRCGCGNTIPGPKGEPGIQGAAGQPGSNGFVSSQIGIVAYAAGGQGMSTSLVAVKNRVDSVPVANASVHLYKAIGGVPQEVINNDTANDLNVYPYFGDKFLGMAVNAPFVISSGTRLLLFCFEGEDGTWTY
jgi:hypothetical protein